MATAYRHGTKGYVLQHKEGLLISCLGVSLAAILYLVSFIHPGQEELLACRHFILQDKQVRMG